MEVDLEKALSVRNLHKFILFSFIAVVPFAVTGQLSKNPILNKFVFFSTLALVGFEFIGCPLTKREKELSDDIGDKDGSVFAQRVLRDDFGIEVKREIVMLIALFLVLLVLGSFFHYKR